LHILLSINQSNNPLSLYDESVPGLTDPRMISRAVRGGYSLDNQGRIISNSQGPFGRTFSARAKTDDIFYGDNTTTGASYATKYDSPANHTLYTFADKDIKPAPHIKSLAPEEIMRNGMRDEIAGKQPLGIKPQAILKATDDNSAIATNFRVYEPANLDATKAQNTVLRQFGLPTISNHVLPKPPTAAKFAAFLVKKIRTTKPCRQAVVLHPIITGTLCGFPQELVLLTFFIFLISLTF
jgi:hypothetical protein